MQRKFSVVNAITSGALREVELKGTQEEEKMGH
jgi:hypothetical protein